MTGRPPKRTRARKSHIEPLWDRIDANRLKVGAFLVVFVASAGAAAAIFTGVAGVFVGVALIRTGTLEFLGAVPWMMLGSAVLGIALALVHAARMLSDSEHMLPGRFGAVRSETGTFLATKSALHDMAIASGYAHSPELWMIEDCDRINAFAVGIKEGHAIVGVTRGFAERLSSDDQRAAFANLMARLCSGDILWATVVSAVMGPIWANRNAQFRSQEAPESVDGEIVPVAAAMHSREAAGAAVAWVVLGFLAVVLTELMMAGHERAALAAAEKADAEGMLLLKGPEAMLAGLARILEANNTVPGAGEEYSMLFYCWAGFGYAPEDDPEMERLGRLREVLGAAGR